MAPPFHKFNSLSLYIVSALLASIAVAENRNITETGISFLSIHRSDGAATLSVPGRLTSDSPTYIHPFCPLKANHQYILSLF